MHKVQMDSESERSYHSSEKSEIECSLASSSDEFSDLEELGDGPDIPDLKEKVKLSRTIRRLLRQREEGIPP